MVGVKVAGNKRIVATYVHRAIGFTYVWDVSGKDTETKQSSKNSGLKNQKNGDPSPWHRADFIEENQ